MDKWMDDVTDYGAQGIRTGQPKANAPKKPCVTAPQRPRCTCKGLLASHCCRRLFLLKAAALASYSPMWWCLRRTQCWQSSLLK